MSNDRDPYLNADYVYNFVSGMQFGEDPNHLKVSSCCKHYGILYCLITCVNVFPLNDSRFDLQMPIVWKIMKEWIVTTSMLLFRHKISRIRIFQLSRLQSINTFDSRSRAQSRSQSLIVLTELR